MTAGPRLDDLRTTPLFRGFADDELAEIAPLFEPAHPGPGGIVFDVDEPGTAFFLLTGGEVTLDRPGDDVYRLRPPALIGELGALTGLRRNTRAVASGDAVLWRLEAAAVQRYFAINQELGVRFLVNLLEVVADKINRDQRHMGDMRRNLITTQKALKGMRELVLDGPDTALSQPIHDTLDTLITHNRRVNYRVEPPPALAATLRLDHGVAPLAELSRTHINVVWPGQLPAVGSWVSGVLSLAGAELPVSGKVTRSAERVTIELDLLIEEYVAILEGYLTRIQLLDILC